MATKFPILFLVVRAMVSVAVAAVVRLVVRVLVMRLVVIIVLILRVVVSYVVNGRVACEIERQRESLGRCSVWRISDWSGCGSMLFTALIAVSVGVRVHLIAS